MSAAPLSIAVVASPRVMAEEGPTLRRSVAALIADGVHVFLFEPTAQRDPDSAAESHERLARSFELPRRAAYEVEVPFWLKRRRIAAMAEACERAAPDLVWSCGADAWDISLALGDQLDRPVALGFRRVTDLPLAVAAQRNDRTVAIVAPGRSLADEARKHVPESLVRLVPLGVRVPDTLEAPTATSPPAPVAAILLESGDADAVQAVLRACRDVREQVPQLELLLECDERRQGLAWRSARTLGLLDRTTAITRGPLTVAAVEACTVLLCPEPAGGPRVETLMALGLGTPLLAAPDPCADALVDGETAVLVGALSAKGSPTTTSLAAATPARGGEQGPGRPPDRALDRQWRDAILATLTHPDAARALALGGREYVRTHHRSSVAAATWRAVASDLVSGGPLRFSTNPA